MQECVLFVSDAPTVTVDGGNVLVVFKSGRRSIQVVMPVMAVREGVKRANRVLDEIAENRPIPLRKLRAV